MFSGICIYAEHNNNILDAVVAELVTVARDIKKLTGEQIQAILIADDCDGLVSQLALLGVDEIYAVKSKTSCAFKDDSTSLVIKQILERVRPSSVLIPASSAARSLFSRVAVLMGTGLTADCTDLTVIPDLEEAGGFYIEQNKPSFGDNIMVSIVTKKDCYPQMMTIRQGIYQPCEINSQSSPVIRYFNDIVIPESKIEILEITPHEAESNSIASAHIVCAGGRGALSEDRLELLHKFASKIGGVVAGTRPLADEGVIPFENQIGQTGKTIRPAICISFGISGAIQHTEGIKDTKLFIAVNSDEHAAIFGVADYGAVADMKDILTCALELL